MAGKVLFIRGGAVGDFILTLPSIRLVRENLSDARLEILGYEPMTRLARAASLADGAKSIEHGPLANFFIPGSKLDPILADYFASFSVVVSYLYDPDGYFRSNLERAGVTTLLQGPHRIDESLVEVPASSQLAKPLEQLALFLDDPFVELTFLPEPSSAAEAFLSAHGFSPVGTQRPFIAIHPGSGSPRKNWSLDSWVEVATRLRRRLPESRFLIISGEAEERTIGEFRNLLTGRGVPFLNAHQLDLAVTGALLKHCALFLGHDTGISHLAAACGIPGILLFGPTDPAIWAPKNPGIQVIKAKADDLSRISPEMVMEKAAPVLENDQGPGCAQALREDK